MSRASGCLNARWFEPCRLKVSTKVLLRLCVVFLLVLNPQLPGNSVDAATDTQSHDAPAKADEFADSTASVQALLQASRAAASKQVVKQAVIFLQNTCSLTNDSDKAAVSPLPAAWLKNDSTTEDSKAADSDEINDLIRRGRAVGKQFRWQSTMSDAISLDIYTAAAQPFFVLQIGALYPVLQLRMGGDCSLVSAKRIDYRVDAETAGHGRVADARGVKLMADTIATLDIEGDLLPANALPNTSNNPEALNPTVPPVSPDSEMNSENTEVAEDPASNETPGAVAVALIDSGVNYTLPAINSALLRDSSGALAGYDYRDDDAMPFDANPRGSPFEIQRHGTQTASVLIAEAAQARIAPFRYPAGNMQRMRDLVAHIDALGIVLVGMPLGGNRVEDWIDFEQAAREHPHILFVASAGNNERNIDQQAVYPAALQLENLLVVSSADDSTLPAAGSNWGRGSVDYLLPAEHVEALRFDGSATRVSGSSYAVPRMLAVLVRLLHHNPDWQAAELTAELRRLFQDGARARYVGGGYIGDPLSVGRQDKLIQEITVREISADKWLLKKKVDETRTINPYEGLPELLLQAEFVVLDDLAEHTSFDQILSELTEVLLQCNIKVTTATIKRVSAVDHLRVMSVGGARTWREHLRASRPSIYLLDSTRLLFEPNGTAYRFDAEAFGRGNTRNRDWLRDSVWLSKGIVDVERAVAHELMHVLMNSGAHVTDPGNLMNAETSDANWRLNLNQCEQARTAGLAHGLLRSH